MQLARNEKFESYDIGIADFAKVLAHPARIAILRRLAERRDCICGDLVLDLPLSQSTVSEHIRILKEAGLIKGITEGQRSRYCIDWKVFARYQKQLTEWSQKLLNLKQDNCC